MFSFFLNFSLCGSPFFLHVLGRFFEGSGRFGEGFMKLLEVLQIIVRVVLGQFSGRDFD